MKSIFKHELVDHIAFACCSAMTGEILCGNTVSGLHSVYKITLSRDQLLLKSTGNSDTISKAMNNWVLLMIHYAVCKFVAEEKLTAPKINFHKTQMK